MGMYTEIYVNVDLKPDTPDEIINVLRAMCKHDAAAECLKDKPGRWSYMFCSGSYYTPDTCCANLTFDSISRQYSLLAKGDIKNYNCEIERFFEFIRPWCESYFMGYYRHESDSEPTLVYCDGE